MHICFHVSMYIHIHIPRKAERQQARKPARKPSTPHLAPSTWAPSAWYQALSTKYQATFTKGFVSTSECVTIFGGHLVVCSHCIDLSLSLFLYMCTYIVLLQILEYMYRLMHIMQ